MKQSSNMTTTLILIGSLLIYATILLLSGLIFWGIGNLIVYVFNISYTWTYLHGLAIALVYATIKETINID